MSVRILIATLLAVAVVFVTARAQAPVRIIDTTTGNNALLSVDATRGDVAKDSGPQVLCYDHATTRPTAVTNGDAQWIWCDRGVVYTRTLDPCSLAKTTLPISQATSTELFTGTASNRIYVCSLLLSQPSGSTQTFSLVSGTGTVCATSTGAMLGATSAANGVQLPFAAIGGNATLAKSDTDAENVCLLQSSTDRIAGVLTYVVAPN